MRSAIISLQQQWGDDQAVLGQSCRSININQKVFTGLILLVTISFNLSPFQIFGWQQLWDIHFGYRIFLPFHFPRRSYKSYPLYNPTNGFKDSGSMRSIALWIRALFSIYQSVFFKLIRSRHGSIATVQK